MQISKVSEVAGCGEGRAGEGGDHAPEYQTASELFDLMTKNTHFDTTHNCSLSAQDLVLLYQNMDIGKRLMNDASEVTFKKPNQYVETVVYNDDHDSGSDCSEILSPNEIQDVFTLNQERLDILNDKSLENLLCPKFGGLEMHVSNLSFDYDKSFLFQDPYIKNQLQNLNLMNSSSGFDNLFSTSLIDYICCKRLEDNYNFYMDNVIRYVQHTIEQLKRISNGDYLTDRAKEKWMEVNCSTEQEDNTKVLATSTSIPLHVECKANGNATWDDIVRSEVDVRSLSKILEKKIIVEIPKLICGSYRLYSKRCADNLIISCQREQQKVENKGQESRVDVVLQLQRSQTGQVISNISSIMVLKTTPALPDLRAQEILPLPYNEETDELTIQNVETDSNEHEITVIQLIKDPGPNVTRHGAGVKNTYVEEIIEEDHNDYQDSQNDDSYAASNDYPFSDRIASYASIQYSSESSSVIRDAYDRQVFPLDRVEDKTYNLISADELHMTMRKLNVQNTPLNETGEDTVSQCTSKRRSPVRVRIKSPYENKSFLMEDKKRKRLLEIRDRREKKKLAFSERCKISKHKFAKGAMFPQASSSVTKLSISNKSFYNSIYGHSANVESKPKPRKPVKGAPGASLNIDETQEDYFESPMLTPEKNSKKYINRSYYLDDAETEMMYMQMKKKENKDIHNPCSASDSNVSNEFNASLEILKEFMGPSETNLAEDETFLVGAKLKGFPEVSCGTGKPLLPIAESTIPLSTATTTQNTPKRSSSSDECRKSIDQLYDLMNRFGKSNIPTDVRMTKSKPVTHVDLNETCIIQGSESGTGVKHTKNAPNHSDIPERNNITASKLKSNKSLLAGSPKVIISSKLNSPKIEADYIKKYRNRRAVVSPPFKGPLPDNPLKAISQLLHEFDNVQKNRQKPPTDARAPKKVENITNDVKTYFRQGSYRRKSRFDQHSKDNQDQDKKLPPHITTKDKRVRPMTPLELARTPPKQTPVEDGNFDRIPPKKITDIIDEAKEARGEAVRGPSKNNSRLHSLAQPKKCYVQAHREEYQNRYGRNVLAERLQKLVTSPATANLVDRNLTSPTTSNNRNRFRKSGTEATASVKQRAPSVPQLDQQKAVMGTRKRRSASSSPESMTRLAPTGHKNSPPTKATDAICKMVAVESYVHSHYGAATLRGEEPVAGLRCRVPLVPQDIDLASMDSSPSAGGAAELGATPHRTVGSAPGPAGSPAPLLAALAECAEPVPRSDPPRSESDYCVDILEDSHVTTAVGAVHAESFSSYGHHPNSAAEMEQLETALYSQISGAFQKRLRIKNLTLTPTPSTQQVFLLQSGDAGSVLVQSVSSLKLKRNSAESLHELKTMPVLSNSNLDWTFAQLPVQIATVGYAFPEHRPQNAGSKAKSIEMPHMATSGKTIQKFCQSSQCLRGLSPRPVRDTAAQADVGTISLASVHNPVVDGHAATSQVTGTESVQVISETHVGALVTVNDTNKAVEESYNGVQEEITIDEECVSVVNPVPETISYTTSLDMLVGILTEIQKITCQNQMVASGHQNCDLNISNDAIAVKRAENTACDLVSMSSLENLRQLESNASIYSFYLSSNEGSVKSVEPVLELKRNSRFTDDSVEVQPAASGCVTTEHVAVGVSITAVFDKEVSANLCEGHADMFTNVPSDVDRGSVPSSRSTLADDYRTPHSSTRTLATNNNIELPQIETRERRALISRDKTDLNEKCFTTLSIRKIEDIEKESLIASRELRYCVKNIDWDPMFKIKRDLLVSMYSILVLTVFAALSFPELLMFES